MSEAVKLDIAKGHWYLWRGIRALSLVALDTGATAAQRAACERAYRAAIEAASAVDDLLTPDEWRRHRAAINRPPSPRG